MVDMSRSIEQHENSQALMESFVELIAQAIDDKSPYTAGHCERVPELGIWLADAASGSTDEAFSKFSFKTPDERREFRLAAVARLPVKSPHQSILLIKALSSKPFITVFMKYAPDLKCCCVMQKLLTMNNY